MPYKFNPFTGNLDYYATSSGGSGTPGGSDTQVQYNNAGAFGGSDQFVFSGGSVAIGSDTPNYTLDVNGNLGVVDYASFGSYVMIGNENFQFPLEVTGLAAASEFQSLSDGTITRDGNNYISEVAYTGGSTAVVTRDANNRVSTITRSLKLYTLTRNASGYIESWAVTDV